jgi:hypothetical protein
MPNLAIDFYTDHDAAVSIEWPPPKVSSPDPQIERFADALQVLCHAFRVLRQRDTNTEGLAIEMLMWFARPVDNPHPDGIFALSSHAAFVRLPHDPVPLEAKKHEDDPAIMLVPFRGVARKRILGTLITSPRAAPRYLLEYKGFGLFGTGLAIAACDSVMLHLTFLVQKHRESLPFLEGLEAATRACSNAYLSNRLTPGNQEALALEIALLHCKV